MITLFIFKLNFFFSFYYLNQKIIHLKSNYLLLLLRIYLSMLLSDLATLLLLLYLCRALLPTMCTFFLFCLSLTLTLFPFLFIILMFILVLIIFAIKFLVDYVILNGLIINEKSNIYDNMYYYIAITILVLY